MLGTVVIALAFKLGAEPTGQSTHATTRAGGDARPEASRADVLEWVPTLPRVERFFCGWLIRRQATHDPRFPQHVERYGPRGTLELLRGKAIHFYIFGLAIAAVVATIASPKPVGIGFLALMGLLGILEFYRLRVAVRTGRRWSSEGA
ncbi:MAG: hypothetical protein ACOYXM_00945 [Actinomycetota bacterium]